MSEIETESMHIIITSPPYEAMIDYDKYEDNKGYAAYIPMMKKVLSECYRVLVPGGRICINIANIGRNPYRPMKFLISELLIKAGFLLKGEIIWKKWANATTTAWGSFMKPSKPALRDVHEYIIIASKGNDPMIQPYPECKADITREEFIEYTNSIWEILPAHSLKHPAIFPDEIPRRLIKLYTWTGCNVLDPFGGSGTVLKVAKELGRIGYTYEISEHYYRGIQLIEGQTKLDDFFDFWEDEFIGYDSLEKGATM